MSFLGQDFDNIFEPKSVKEGEYQLRVLDAQSKTSSKTGGDYISVKLEIVGEPEAKDINHVMMMPTSNDDVKKRNSRLSAIANFLKACGLDPATTSNVNEVIGCSCWAILAEEADPEYGMQNRVRKFVAGR
ncbi:MAG: hypothetical protein BWY21_01089 [Parcubacteria group bacterium ADurb.Bin216]|nr:MAG: hypothetical protein BWY21_01089 [Parcubacteria group bacterium ADurb.Bin216]